MKRTNALTRLVSWLLFGALLCYLGVYIVRALKSDVRTAPAVYVTLAETAPAPGIVARKETLVESGEKYLSVVAENGAVLAKGETVAVTYSSEEALSRDAQITELESKKAYISAVLAGALMRLGLVDELLLYLAPNLLGPGRGMADMGPLETLAQGLALQFQGVERVGPDLRVLARVAGRDAF